MYRPCVFPILAIFLASAAPALGNQSRQTCKPEYIGKLVLSPDANGRSMTLQAPFAFRDKACIEWEVPKDAAVDGASIPRIFWTPIGGPWEGNYRNASVIHDWYCSVRTRPWKAVHRMFFDGMIASGVGPKMAKLMYLAVYYRGPRWDDLTIRNSRLLRAEMKRVNPDVVRQMSAAYSSLTIGQVTAAEASLATARSEMRTNGDQFAVASLARDIARTKNDMPSATKALDAMIFSGVPDAKTLSGLQVERAKLAFDLGDYPTAAQNARSSLSVDFSDDAVQLLANLKRNAPAAVEDDTGVAAEFEPTEIEFQRLANIVESGDLSPEEIERLVDEVRKPSRE